MQKKEGGGAIGPQQFFLGVRIRMFLVSNLGYWRFNHFYLPFSLSIQMPFHIRKLESALLMQDLLALLSGGTPD